MKGCVPKATPSGNRRPGSLAAEVAHNKAGVLLQTTAAGSGERSMQPSCTTSHGQPVTAQSTTAPSAATAITKEPQNRLSCSGPLGRERGHFQGLLVFLPGNGRCRSDVP